MVIKRACSCWESFRILKRIKGPEERLKGVLASWEANISIDFNCSSGLRFDKSLRDCEIDIKLWGRITWFASPCVVGNIVLKDSCLWMRSLKAFSRASRLRGPDNLRAKGTL